MIESNCVGLGSSVGAESFGGVLPLVVFYYGIAPLGLLFRCRFFISIRMSPRRGLKKRLLLLFLLGLLPATP